jgi:hypothetical protein
MIPMSIGTILLIILVITCSEALVGFEAADSMGPGITAVVDWAL